jgi:predicted transcriptional regulator of viral defense system
MKWEDFLKEFSDRPLFHSSMLRIFDDAPAHIEVQLSRWSRSGKLCRIRRGWYLIEEPYRARDVSEAVIANSVVQPSYLSLEWALGFYGLIPEAVFNPTSITTARGIEFTTKHKRYFYHHVQPAFFAGYEKVERGGDVFIIAGPEKALLDKMYIAMRSSGLSEAWLKGLRPQNLDVLDVAKLRALAALVGKPGFVAAVDAAAAYIRKNREG